MSSDDKVLVETKTIDFERVRLAGKKFFGPQELEMMEFTTRQERIIDALVFEWSTMCKGEVLRNESKEVTFEYPKNWWEHFKYAKFPGWLLKKYPAKWHRHTQIVTFKEIAVYPKLSEFIKTSNNRMDYLIHTQVEPYWIRPIDMTEKPK